MGGNRLHPGGAGEDTPESSRRRQVKLRAPEQLVEDYDDGLGDTSRAEDLRDHMREVAYGSDRRDDEGMQPPGNHVHGVAYKTLCKLRSDGGVVRGEQAKRALAAQLPHHSKADIYPVLSELQDLGYVGLESFGVGTGKTRLIVHVRPWSTGGGQA